MCNCGTVLSVNEKIYGCVLPNDNNVCYFLCDSAACVRFWSEAILYHMFTCRLL